MIRGVNLAKRLESHMQSGQGNAGYRKEFREFLGLAENVRTGEPCFDHAKRVIDPMAVDFAEVADTFLDLRHKTQSEAAALLSMAFDPQFRMAVALREADGGTVLPSHFANINAFTDTVTGLIDALALQGYERVEAIGDEFMTIKEARVQGGKRIGMRNDGNMSGDLSPDEPYPTVGGKETYVSLPNNRRRGQAMEINQQVFLYDRTDQVQQMGIGIGEAVRRAREIDQADCVLGKTNNYSRDGVASNTYRLLADTTMALDNAGDRAPNNYINAKSSTPFTDWTSWNVAKQLLSRNVDPATGWEISIPAAESVLWVWPESELLAKTIVGSTGVQIRGGYDANVAATTQSSAYTLQVRNAPNPLSEYGIKILSSRLWANRLLVSGTNHPTSPTAFSASYSVDATIWSSSTQDTAAKAQSAWLWGAPKRAFEYRQIVPFESFQGNLSAEQQKRDIVAVFIAREMGVSMVIEPRYMFFGANTLTA